MADDDQELGRWERPLRSSSERLAAWSSTLFKDHGAIRLIYRNRHKVSDELWRSSQPVPSDIRWARRNGVRTIISLRHSSNFGAWPLVSETCERKGLNLVNLPLFSREPPTHDAVRYANKVFNSIEYPALLHCKSGADRAGFASTIYLMVIEGEPLEKARRMLSPRYLHFRFTKTGILDHILDSYGLAKARSGIGFEDWVRTAYDPAALQAEFDAGRRAT